MQQPVVAATGLSGFVGHRFGELFGKSLKLVDWYHRNPAAVASASFHVDVRDGDALAEALERDRPQAVLNIGAQANVDVCERERGDREGDAWRSNAEAPGVIARACARASVRFVHVSTDYVFDGHVGAYAEDSPTSHAANWYGETKLFGERSVQELGNNYAIARIVMPFCKPPASRIDLPQLVRSRLTSEQLFLAAYDQLVSPTLLDDIADALAALAFGSHRGIYHLSGATLLSPYEAALIVARTFGLDDSLVRPVTLAELTLTSGRAPRPLRTALLSHRFRAEFADRLARPLRGFAEGIGTFRTDGRGG